jgi:hypothetical protein
MKQFSKLIFVFVIIFMLFSMTAIVSFAQDDIPFQPPAPVNQAEAISPLVLYQMVLDLIIAALVIPGAVPVVNVLTSIGKRFIPSSLISASTLAAGLTLIAYIGFWLAVHFGLQTEFEFGLNSIYQFGTVILGLVGSQKLAHKSYKWSAEAKTPILGYSAKSVVEVDKEVTTSDWQG